MYPVHMRTVSRMHPHMVRMTAATIVVRLARNRTSAGMMAALVHILTHRLHRTLSLRAHLALGSVDGSAAALRLSTLRLHSLRILVAALL